MNPIIPNMAELADRLYRALKLSPCRCAMRWGPKGEMETVKTCTRCDACEEYETMRELAT